MLQITKQGNSIVVKGLDHALYPYSGTLEIPCNSVITVVDEGDIVTFRSASNYDVLFSGLVSEITINGEAVTKENVGDKFGAISNTTSGGGLTPEQEQRLNNAVQISNYNADKEAQATIDESQNASIEVLRGNIDGKQDKIADLNIIRDGAEKGATAIQDETDPVWTAEKVNYYNKVEVDTLVGEAKSSANSAISIASSAEGIANEANTRANEAMVELEKKANKSEIPSLDGYATESWVEGKGYLTEHQDISGKQDVITDLADIRNGAALGKTALQSFTETDPTVPAHVKAITEEDIAKWNQGGGGEPNEYIKNAEKSVDGNTLTLTKKDGSEVVFSQNLDGYATEQWVGQQGYLTEHQPLKTINGETIVGEGDITAKGRDVWAITPITYLGSETTVYFYVSKNGYFAGSSSYEVKCEVINSNGNVTIKTATQDGDRYRVTNISSDALYIYVRVVNPEFRDGSLASCTFILNDKMQQRLTSGTNIKTINGESILGSGDLVISGGGGEETDPIWTAEKVNYYTKAEVDEMIGNINNALATLING